MDYFSPRIALTLCPVISLEFPSLRKKGLAESDRELTLLVSLKCGHIGPAGCWPSSCSLKDKKVVTFDGSVFGRLFDRVVDLDAELVMCDLAHDEERT